MRCELCFGAQYLWLHKKFLKSNYSAYHALRINTCTRSASTGVLRLMYRSRMESDRKTVKSDVFQSV